MYSTIMSQNWIFFFLLSSAIALTSCSKEGTVLEPSSSTNLPVASSDWFVPQNQIIGSLSPFPIINNPTYTTVESNQFRSDNSRVILYKSKNNLYVFPNSEMYVEAVNDIIDGLPIAMTYCPKTKSAVGINRIFSQDTLLITASGFLYKENMVPMDVKSNKMWSQMAFGQLKGDLENESLRNIPIVETIWKNVVDDFPNAKVYVSHLDSFDYNTTNRTDGDEIVQTTGGNTNPDIISKTRYYGILSAKAPLSLFSYEHFSNKWTIESIWDKRKIIVLGNQARQCVVAYYAKYDFIPIQGQYPLVMKDETDTYWNVFGEAIAGPRKGERLAQPISYVARGESWKDFFKEINFYP